MIINYECRRQRAHQPKKKEIDTISGSISKRGMNFVVIGKCGSFYIYHEKAGKKIEIKCPAENNF